MSIKSRSIVNRQGGSQAYLWIGHGLRPRQYNSSVETPYHLSVTQIAA